MGLFAAGVLVVGVAISTAAVWHARRSRPSSRAIAPMERLTFDTGLTMMPAVSTDGLLLVYASNRGSRGDLDIWVQQTTGGTPLRLTDDPADDDSPAFSPDGKQIAFRSDRANPGVYLVPTFGGAARLVAPEGRRPVFSPDGSHLAYWTGQWRGPATQFPSETFVLSLTDGRIVRVLPTFGVARDPVWSPDGQALLVLGKQDLTSSTEATLDWWWVPVDGSSPRATGALNLPGWRQAAASAPTDLTLSAWTPTGIILSMQGNLWRLAMSPFGEIRAAPQRLTYGPGRTATPPRAATDELCSRRSSRNASSSARR